MPGLLPIILGVSTILGAPLAYAASGSGESVIYSFQGGSDGATPTGTLIDVNGVLYGATASGGIISGCGTAFSVTQSGVKTTLHTFAGATDGCNPTAGLTKVGGSLYGTTFLGGIGNNGIIYRINLFGEKNLHSFSGAPTDGASPLASMLNLHGILFGTTELGGASNSGTVFKTTTNGVGPVESLVHSFGGIGDGDAPFGPLTNINGTLYGVTQSGGSNGDGTVYKIDPTGTESVVYSFAGNSAGGIDGRYPAGNILNVYGTLYGVTMQGGSCFHPFGCGTVFKITPGGTESVIHSFGNDSDGEFPESGLIKVGHYLYGTTTQGGIPPNFAGVVFKISLLDGSYSVVYSFTGGSDGGYPFGNLVNVTGVLYGATQLGGVYNFGTVYKITQP